MTETVYPLAGAAALERRGLRDRVYDLVLDMLMTADLAPGTRLSIDAIARDLKVSPTPVREALVQLERTGLVTREALKGYRVARLVLEGGATELAARHAEALVPRLEQALAEHIEISHLVDQTVDEGEKLSVGLIRDYFAVDWNFHHLIFEGTQNPFLIDMSEAISTRVHRMRQTVKSGVSDADEAVIEHGAILDAFRSGEPGAATRAMRDHIERVRERARRDVASS
jgi:DNA-binding GntR family transcriptional regulator